MRQCSPASRQNPGQPTMSRRSRGATSEPPVALAAQRRTAFGPTSSSPDDPPGEVHAEERIARVGHRVDHPPHELALRGGHRHVLAAERHDPRPASPSASRASRSACSPPHTTSRSTRMPLPGHRRRPRRRAPLDRRSPASRAAPRRRPPRFAGHRLGDTATKSVIAVCGECSAASPPACGSTSRMPAPLDPAQAGHAVGAGPLARGRRSAPARTRRPRRRACRTRRTAMPCSAQ